jgi:hypothetical protein
MLWLSNWIITGFAFPLKILQCVYLKRRRGVVMKMIRLLLESGEARQSAAKEPNGMKRNETKRNETKRNETSGEEMIPRYE